MLLLEYPKCSTCKKAIAWLKKHELEFTDRHIKDQPPTVDELKEWYRKSGLPLKKFFNTGGMRYKELGLKDRLMQMSEDEQIALLSSDGMLVKRPLLITDEKILVGFREADWEQALLKP